MLRKFFLFLFLLSLNKLFFNFVFAETITKGVAAERAFIRHYINRLFGSMIDDLHEAEEKRRIAICNAVLNNKEFFDDFRMYLNKLVSHIYTNSYNYQKNLVKLNVLRNIISFDIMYKMFPCHGRHDPVRSSWSLDDYYDMVFLSEGPVPDSLFIFVRQLYPSWEIHEIYGLITDIPINSVPEVNYTVEELKYEFFLDNQSYNSNIREIEVLYLRNFSYVPFFQIQDNVCSFNIEQKMELCETILSRNIYQDFHWQLNKNSFKHSESKCTLKVLEFKYFSNYSNLVEQEMYPCFDTHIIDETQELIYPNNVQTKLYLSKGFRDNSILVYTTVNHRTYFLYEFIENIWLDDISGENYKIIEEENSSIFDIPSTSNAFLDLNGNSGNSDNDTSSSDSIIPLINDANLN